MNKKRDIVSKIIYEMSDFPVFRYWDVNRRQFEPRALNKMSIRFNDNLARQILELARVGKETEELAKAIIYSAKYAYFGNASYEADGPNSHGGGDDSIQEQLVCWLLECPVSDYREGRVFAYSDEVANSPRLRDWLKDSELYELFLKLGGRK